MQAVAFAVTAFAVAMLVLAHRPSRAAAVWGVLWGEVLGFAFVAPASLSVHHLSPTTPFQWAIVLTFFGAVSAVAGCALAVLGSAALAAVPGARHRGPWPGLVTLGVVPCAYLAVSYALESASFRQFAPLAPYGTLLGVTVPACLLAIGAGAAISRRWGGRIERVPVRAAVAAVAATLALTLPLRMGAAPAASDADPPPLERVSMPGPPEASPGAEPGLRPAPLLLIGIDGAGWRVLRPVMDRGLAPTLARLQERGMHGDMAAAWPPFWSTPAWGAILTGYPKDELGVNEDLALTAPGLPAFEVPLQPHPLLNPLFILELALARKGVLLEAAPPGRDMLRRPPIWERLSRAGARTAVVRFRFTYPAHGQADYVVSDRVLTDLWFDLGVRVGDRERLASPAPEADGLLRWFEDEQPSTLDTLARMLPAWNRPAPADASMNPIDVLKIAADELERSFGLTEALLRRDPEIDVLMLYVGGLDLVSHAFWQYRFPDDVAPPRPAQLDIEQLGPAVDRYVEELDARIGRLIQSFPAAPNVMIVSDHSLETSRMSSLWKAWHASPGVVLLAGPDIPARRETLHVTYLDVVPTMLELAGFDVPRDLGGRSLAGGP